MPQPRHAQVCILQPWGAGHQLGEQSVHWDNPGCMESLSSIEILTAGIQQLQVLCLHDHCLSVKVVALCAFKPQYCSCMLSAAPASLIILTNCLPSRWSPSSRVGCHMMARGVQTACCLNGLSSTGKDSHITLLGAQGQIISHWHTVADPADAAEHCYTAAHSLLSVSAMCAAKQTKVITIPAEKRAPMLGRCPMQFALASSPVRWLRPPCKTS